ncbi:MAG: DUF975 family protein [Treponemataceae bacterium]|nr:MAG: DUF975 family protein [Treponemataceae bacterium]
MLKSNRELREIARSQLKGRWLEAVGFTFLYGILTAAASAVVGIGEFILGGPFTYGYYGYFSRKARGEEAQIENLFEGFHRFGSAFLLFLLETLFITLWLCLLIVPGIVKWFSYSMAFFILRDNPNMSAIDAITASRKMMKGYKGDLFGLYLSFIGWWFLSLFSFGIGYFWLAPYVSLSHANFYEELKRQTDIKGADQLLN